MRLGAGHGMVSVDTSTQTARRTGAQSRWRPYVLIVDDDRVASASLEAAMPAADWHVECVTSTSAARQALDRVESSAFCARPVFVLLEPLIDANVGEFLLALRRLRPGPSVAVISRSLDNERSVELKMLGVEVSLRKPVRTAEIRRLTSMLLWTNEALVAAATFGAEMGLSERQLRVLWCALENIPTKETASYLGISPETVRTQWGRILDKTDCACPAAVLTAARERCARWLAADQALAANGS